MVIAILKDTAPAESRVCLVPEDVRRLVDAGHRLAVAAGAGEGSGYSDDDFRRAGAVVAPGPAAALENAQLALQVKEPLPEAIAAFRPGQVLGCFLNVDRHPDLVTALSRAGVAALSFQRITVRDGSRPLLTAMSTIAGRQAVRLGMGCLASRLPGAGAGPLRVIILGGGAAGVNAAVAAAQAGASITLYEKDRQRILTLRRRRLAGVEILDIFSAERLASDVAAADLLINTVPLAQGCHLVDRFLVARMRKGSVIVDVAAQPGGAVETVDRLTTLDAPCWQVDGVTHCAVPNLPGAAPRAASRALSKALVPYVLRIAENGLSALQTDPGLARAAIRPRLTPT